MTTSFKTRIKAFRTRSFLKQDGELPPQARNKLEALTQTQLAAAAINPDHSEDGRAHASRLLASRGGSLDEAEIIVPGFVKPADMDALRKRFFGVSRQIRKWSGVLALLCFVGAFVAVGFSEELKAPALEQGLEAGLITRAEYNQRARGVTDEEFDAARAAGVEMSSAFSSDVLFEELLLPKVRDTPAGRNQALAQSITWVVISGLVLFTLVWLASSALRRQPARLLLLRKFNDKELAKSMEHVITDELRPFGHIVTLSDKHIRRARFAWLTYLIPTNFLSLALIFIWLPLRLILRQFNRSKHGAAFVGNARDYRNLAKRLRDRMALNMEVAMTSKEAFIVRTDDDWWKLVVSLLMNSADVMVVDLSNVTQGTQWELERLDRLGFFERAVLTVRDDREAAARAAMSGFRAAQNANLYVYDKLGDMSDRDGFRDAMLAAINRTLESGARIAT